MPNIIQLDLGNPGSPNLSVPGGGTRGVIFALDNQGNIWAGTMRQTGSGADSLKIDWYPVAQVFH